MRFFIGEKHKLALLSTPVRTADFMAQNVRHYIGECITVIAEDFVISKLYMIILCTLDYAVNRKIREPSWNRQICRRTTLRKHRITPVLDPGTIESKFQ